MLLRAMLQNDDGSHDDGSPDFHLIRAYGRLLMGVEGVTFQVRIDDGNVTTINGATFENVTTINGALLLYDHLLKDCVERRWEGAVAYDPNQEYNARKMFEWFLPTNQVKIKGILWKSRRAENRGRARCTSSMRWTVLGITSTCGCAGCSI